MNITLAPRWASSTLLLNKNAYIDCGAPPILSKLSSFTLEAWVNTTTLSGFQSIVGNTTYSGGFANGQYSLYLYDGFVQAASGFSDDAFLKSPQPLTADDWHHVAVTMDGNSGTFTLYVDGNQAAQVVIKGSMPGTTNHTFIGGALEDGTPTGFFQGQIGRVQIYNVAQTPEDILNDSVQLSIYDAIETPELIFHADFSAMPTVDGSGNNIPLVYLNNPQYLLNVPAVVLGQKGYVDCGSYPDYSLPGNDSYTLEGWFFPSAASNGTLLSYGLKGAWEYQVLYQNNQVIGKRNSDGLQLASNSSVVPLSYYHFALTYDGETNALSLYINGNLQRVAYFPGQVTGIPNGSVLVGAQFDSTGAPTGFFNGAIQNIRIWNVSLEQSEICQWMYNDIVDDDRLVANYDFTVSPPVDNTDDATLTLVNGALQTLQQSPIAITDPLAQLGVPQSINAVYLNQHIEPVIPAPSPIELADQPPVFSDKHREESWAQIEALYNPEKDPVKRSRYRQQFEAGYEKARQMTLDNPNLLKGFTRTDEKGMTRIIYHGITGDVLVYEGVVGAQTECTLWWITFIFMLTVGFLQALGLAPSFGDIGERIYNLVRNNATVMAAITSNLGRTITAASAIGIMKVIYSQGLMWAIIKFALTSAGWYALLWILKKIIGIVTGLEAAALLGGFIVWAAQLSNAALKYKPACGGKKLEAALA